MRRTTRNRIKPEDQFAMQLQAASIHYEREYRFHPTRRWRSDFYIPVYLSGQRGIIVEIEGGAFIGGRHTRGRGFSNDCIKYNEIALRGYILLRGTPEHVRSGALLKDVERALTEVWLIYRERRV